MMREGEFIPTGTCFAVSDRYLLTAQRNMDKKRLVGYGIASSVSKTNGVEDIPEDFHFVDINCFNVLSDWAIVELSGSPFTEQTVPIPITTVEVKTDTDFVVFHMPISDYMFRGNDGISLFAAWMRTAKPRKHHVEGNGSLFKGSSGAPFVLRNGRAFAMHLESRNEVIRVYDGRRDDAEVHPSRCSGLYFKTCPELLRRLLELGVRTIN